MNLGQRIKAFVELGKRIDEELNSGKDFYDLFNGVLGYAKTKNQWFTEENQKKALTSISKILDEKSLNEWTSKYDLRPISPKKIVVIMAGNIPLVGFHDFLSVLISGHNILAKTSSEDALLLPKLVDLLLEIEPDFKNKIEISSNKVHGMDAVIATGSNNSARYFEAYFGKFSNIIRKNRTSVAVVGEKDAKEDLQKLGNDIFQYFGLGCRNVSKLFIPENFELDTFFEQVLPYGDLIHHNKYNNNYSYNRTIYLMNEIPFFDNNFMILKEDKGLHSPISVVYFERYSDINEVKQKLENQKEHIQCVVSNQNLGLENQVGFGEAQQPKLWDYADGIDTMEFLASI